MAAILDEIKVKLKVDTTELDEALEKNNQLENMTDRCNDVIIEEIKESLYEQFKVLKEASTNCNEEELVKLTLTMIDIYKVISKDR